MLRMGLSVVVFLFVVACGFDTSGGSGAATDGTDTTGETSTADGTVGETVVTISATATTNAPTSSGTGTTTTGESSDTASTDCELILWYLDGDGDEFGRDGSRMGACDRPGANWVEQGGDCDDEVPTANPDADEECDGFDNDCDGKTDEYSRANPDCNDCSGLIIGDALYYNCSPNLPWDGAEAHCQLFGAHLASIHNPETNTTLAELLAQNVNAVWIGLHDRDVEGEFEWADGSRLDFDSWAMNQPDDMNGQDCVALRPNGIWRDASCGTRSAFFCSDLDP